jgi:hypothetical protein
MKEQQRQANGEPFPHVRYMRHESGSLHERLSLQPPPEELDEGMTEIDEATYLDELRVLEDLIEDHARDLLRTDAERQATDHAALVKVKIPPDVAARLTGHEPAKHGARLVAAAEYNDPKRRTVRRAV